MYEFYPESKKSFFEKHSINFFLVVLNILVFVVLGILYWMKIIPIDFFAIKPENIIHGKYLWTFLTSMFMHAGFFHIFANMISLVFVGNLIEKIIGRKRYLGFYLISGLFAGAFYVLVSYLFNFDMQTYAVGASGALFGLVGVLMFLTPNLRVFMFFIPIPIKMKYAAPGMLLLLWLISVTAGLGIGNFAHLGGLIAGVCYGIYLRLKFPNKTGKISRYFS
jgi:uncharacterized protein